MNFLDLQQNVYRKVGFSDTPAPEVSARVKMYLNEVHRRVLGMPGMDYLRTGLTTFATVASTSRYGLPYDVQRIMSVRDTSNDIKLRSESFQWFTEAQPDPATSTGNPEIWVPVGYGALRMQPSDSSTLYAVSSSASDTTPKLTVEGIRSGNLTTATVPLTGTNPVSLGAWTQVNKAYLTALPVGTVSIWEDDAVTGTLLATLPIGKTHFRYFNIALWPTPSSAITLTVDYLRNIEDMVGNTDQPMLPEDFHWVLSAGARMMEWEKQDDKRYAVARDEYERGVRDLKWFVRTRADAHEMSGMGEWRGSRLGPWFPRGT